MIVTLDPDELHEIILARGEEGMSGFPTATNIPEYAKFTAALIRANMGVCFAEKVGGAIKAVASVLMFPEYGGIKKTAMLHFWYSDKPGAGRIVLTFAEKWAMNNGAEYFVAEAPAHAPRILGKYYEKRGMVKSSTRYVKGL